MKVEIFEILLICIVISIQFYVFYRTYIQIRLFESIIPDINNLAITNLSIPNFDLAFYDPNDILANIDDYKNYNGKVATTDDGTTLELSEVNIVTSTDSDNYIFNKIQLAINNYLIRNRGAASDFNLIKDIIERNTDAIEEDINISISIPLYLGLMGTMLGIVIGLFNMPDLGDNESLDQGITLLIGGVKIAMIASFVGLLLTIVNSGLVYKKAKSLNENKKNDLYTFIQIELLPIINQGLASTFESLQRNLLKFNDEFSVNLKGLNGIFDSSRSAIKEQKDLLDALDKAKVSDMTKYNVTVLKQLDVSVKQFEKFNDYMSNVNLFVENSQQIVKSSNELLKRTSNFKVIAENLENRLGESEQLISFLSEHFNKLEEHKTLTSTAVADVGFAISDTFRELKDHIQNSSEAIKQFTIEETEELKNALAASRTNLHNLEYLANLNINVAQFKDDSVLHKEELAKALELLNTNIADSVNVLKKIEQTSFSNTVIDITSSIGSIFRSKKK